MAQSYHGKRATPHSCFQHPTYRELVLQLHHFAGQSDGRSIANTIWGLAGKGRKPVVQIVGWECHDAISEVLGRHRG